MLQSKHSLLLGSLALLDLVSSKAGCCLIPLSGFLLGIAQCLMTGGPCPRVALGLVDGENPEFSAVTQGRLGHTTEEGYKQSAPWGRLFLPGASQKRWHFEKSLKEKR